MIGPPFFFMPPSNTPTKRGRPAGAVQLLTPLEVAERLSVPLKTVYDWTYKLCSLDSKPILPTKRLGRRVRIPEPALELLEERLAHRAAAPFSFFSAHDATPSKSGGDKR